MLEKGEDPIDVSLYLFRDQEADRAGIEKYNIMCFDTPEGEKSLVKVITDILDETVTISVPKPLKVALRTGRMEGADLAVYKPVRPLLRDVRRNGRYRADVQRRL